MPESQPCLSGGKRTLITSAVELALMVGVWAWAGWRAVVCVVVMCVVVGCNREWTKRA